MTKKQKVKEILSRLYEIWPIPSTSLNFNDAWELLVATILSAQTTDRQVNKILPKLFAKYPSIEHFANASNNEISEYIKSVNYHNSKASYIKKSAQLIINNYDGLVPNSMEELIKLPGVARKTANVVLGNAFGKTEGIAVDTHVARLSLCFGLTKSKDPKKIEVDLMKIVPRQNWTDWTHLLINYGREYCPSRKDCSTCPMLGDLCKV